MKNVFIVILAFASFPLFSQKIVGDFNIKVKNRADFSVYSDNQGYLSINRKKAGKHDLFLYSPEKKLLSTLNIPYGKNYLGTFYGVSSLEDRFIYYYTNPDNRKNKIDAYVLLKRKNAANGMVSAISVINEKEKSIIGSLSVDGIFFLVIANKKTYELEFLNFENTETYKTYSFPIAEDVFQSITKSSFQYISREEELTINKTYHKNKTFCYGNSVYFVMNKSRKNSNKVIVHEFDLSEMESNTTEFNLDLNSGSIYNSFLLEEYLFTFTVSEKRVTLNIYNYLTQTHLKRYRYSIVDSLNLLPSKFYNYDGTTLVNPKMVSQLLNDDNKTPSIACSKLDGSRYVVRFGVYSPATTMLATGPEYNYMMAGSFYFSGYGETILEPESINYFEVVLKSDSFELEQKVYLPSYLDKMNLYINKIKDEETGYSNEQLIYHMGSIHLIYYDKSSKSIKLVEL